MTNDRAIEVLKAWDLNYQDEFTAHEFDEALRMAIKALEQEPKFIAKSDGTIEQIKNCNDCLFKKEWEKIGKFISVVLEKQTEQEPKAGHWIDLPFSFECSECGIIRAKGTSGKYNFCPNCGARMIESQAE